MKAWRARGIRIEEVEVDRIKRASVWIDGQRRCAHSVYENYYETLGEAYAAVLAEAESNLKGAHQALDRARSNLEIVKTMKP